MSYSTVARDNPTKRLTPPDARRSSRLLATLVGTLLIVAMASPATATTIGPSEPAEGDITIQATTSGTASISNGKYYFNHNTYGTLDARGSWTFSNFLAHNSFTWSNATARTKWLVGTKPTRMRIRQTFAISGINVTASIGTGGAAAGFSRINSKCDSGWWSSQSGQTAVGLSAPGEVCKYSGIGSVTSAKMTARGAAYIGSTWHLGTEVSRNAF